MTGKVVQPGDGKTYLVLGDLFTILATGEETGGAYGLVETLMRPQGFIPPHIHDDMDEVHYILDGEVEYQIDERTVLATPGTFIHIFRGQCHSFKNVGLKPAKSISWVTPAGGEQFFAEAGQLVQPKNEDEKLSLLGKVDADELEKAIALAATKYKLRFVVPTTNAG
ncbi:cupin 2 domain-containing protein [Nostoc sp. NIES-3756]|uniref:cupin domain-containing protein n=1 Tax=Nostoc sp. NIES-3756 TaxID=1751286 RepID=UPI00071EFF08|nr:cupin domain-containing protein [Nostoc sp. NIES-3756]BAT52016.1 cupin 2 domain-containing protein [Nostoc sp. NIES-3756]